MRNRGSITRGWKEELSCTSEWFCVQTNWTCFFHDEKEKLTCFIVKLATQTKSAKDRLCTNPTFAMRMCCDVQRLLFLETGARSRTWRFFKCTRATVGSIIGAAEHSVIYQVQIKCLQKHLLKHVHRSFLVSTMVKRQKHWRSVSWIFSITVTGLACLTCYPEQRTKVLWKDSISLRVIRTQYTSLSGRKGVLVTENLAKHKYFLLH